MRLSGVVKKDWGHENIFFSNDLYCLKHLVFETKMGKTSMHFHKEKHETWMVDSGAFMVSWIDTERGVKLSRILNVGDKWVNPPLLPHQLEALEDNSIMIEVSTADSVEDNYRIYR